jgi:hypothetical protein
MVLVLSLPRDQLIHRFRMLVVPFGDFYIAHLLGLCLGLMYLGEALRAYFYRLLKPILGGNMNWQSRLLLLWVDFSADRILILHIQRVQVLLVKLQEVLCRREDH